jgi:hypothetical protein
MSYQCHNRAPFLSSIPVADGFYMDGYTRTPRMVPMPFRMEPGCQYTHSNLGQADKACTGCKWRATA